MDGWMDGGLETAAPVRVCVRLLRVCACVLQRLSRCVCLTKSSIKLGSPQLNSSTHPHPTLCVPVLAKATAGNRSALSVSLPMSQEPSPHWIKYGLLCATRIPHESPSSPLASMAGRQERQYVRKVGHPPPTSSTHFSCLRSIHCHCCSTGIGIG